MTTSRSEAARSSRQPLSLVPDRDCPLCPRLVAFREANRAREPLWHNAPVAPFGDIKARLLIVGLAPGMQGANRTGRPFTGDYAGDLLYATLLEYGFAKGKYQARPDDGLKLVDCRIANAVHCVPPQNMRAIVALGRIAHDTVLKPLKLKGSQAPFGHGAVHQAGAFRLYDSYHCSRYNTNTRVLTPDMFRSVFAKVKADLD
jgi:uracil-DNA glycosylase